LLVRKTKANNFLLQQGEQKPTENKTRKQRQPKQMVATFSNPSGKICLCKCVQKLGGKKPKHFNEISLLTSTENIRLIHTNELNFGLELRLRKGCQKNEAKIQKTMNLRNNKKSTQKPWN